MKTKFIGLDGFHEIETLKTTRKVKKHYVKKTVRCFKEATKTAYCFMQSFNKPKQNASQKTPTLDACYKNARMGNKSEYAVKVLDFSKYSKKQLKKTAYQVNYNREHSSISKNFLKHKAALGTATACVACAFVVMTFFGTSFNVNASEQTTAQPLSSNAVMKNENFVTYTADKVENSSDLALAVSNATISTETVGLYIDGEFIGAVSEEYALYQALENVLNEYKEGYDESTVVEYVNEIEVTAGEYEEAEIVTVSELMANAESLLSISLTTNEVYEREIPYESETQYDDTQTTDYCETIQYGENGLENVLCRTTYINGEEVDSVVISSETITEPVNEIVMQGTIESTTGTFAWPVPNTYNVTSYYGYRWGTIHEGIDISNGVTDEAIVASDGGTVTWAGWDDSGYGYYVIIDHGNGYSTLYGHCNSVYVSQGEYVSQGQTIAGMGSTGYSTGTHLHFEIREGSTRLDPMTFFG